MPIEPNGLDPYHVAARLRGLEFRVLKLEERQARQDAAAGELLLKLQH